MTAAKFFTGLLAVAAGVAAHDNDSPLDKPVWLQGLDAFESGLEAMPQKQYTLSQWDASQIPDGVQKVITNNGAACNTGINYNPGAMTTWNVTYEDCGTPWYISMHSDSGITIDSMAAQFGRMPIQMRQWVRHVITVPDTSGHAFNCAGDIVFFRPVDNMMTAVVHETGHSLDLLGAYGGIQLSDSDDWWNNYGQDSCTTDPYGQTKMIEEMAQTHVLATFNENVDGGVQGLIANGTDVFHQYATVITYARNNGNGNSILNQGQSGDCKHNIDNSPAVAVVPTSGQRRVVRSEESFDYNITNCGLTW